MVLLSEQVALIANRIPTFPASRTIQHAAEVIRKQDQDGLKEEEIEGGRKRWREVSIECFLKIKAGNTDLY